MKPIHKFNNGNGATLCHICRTIITVGKPTNYLYCDRCLRERNHTEAEFIKLKSNLKRYDNVKANFTIEEFNEQMNEEVHFNRSNLNM